MEENYTEVETRIREKKLVKFAQNVSTLQKLVTGLLIMGAAISTFGIIQWHNTQNDILRYIGYAGIFAFISSIIGLIGCRQCQQDRSSEVRTTKMKEIPGQTMMIVFFCLNYIIICAFLLSSTWCFFFQKDGNAWLEARYSDRQSWEHDFQNQTLSEMQNKTSKMLQIAGVLSISISVINFIIIYYSMKISMAFETIHTVVQVQNLVIVILGFAVIYAGSVARSYYDVPLLSDVEPAILPRTLFYTGIGMIIMAFLGFAASKSENEKLLQIYVLINVVLLIIFGSFTMLLNYSSTVLQTTFEDKCLQILPYFHKSFYKNFGCPNKYIQTTDDLSALHCSKQEMTLMWEPNVGIPINDQTEKFACLNSKCCISMISHIKGKFDFLSAFCIVGVIFIIVVIMNVYYMYKKLKGNRIIVLIHKKDNMIFGIMAGISVILGAICILKAPSGPHGPPIVQNMNPVSQDSFISSLYQDRSMEIGKLELTGWWNFERIDFFKYLDDSIVFRKQAQVTILSHPDSGEFQLTQAQGSILTGGTDGLNVNQTTAGLISLTGPAYQVEDALSRLKFRPGCIYDQQLSLEIDIKVWNSGSSILDAANQLIGQDNSTIQKGYLVNLSMLSGKQRHYRGKIYEASTGKDVLNIDKQNVSMKVTTPAFKTCKEQEIKIVEPTGIFEFSVPVLNSSLPYLIEVQIMRPSYQTISFDLVVGGSFLNQTFTNAIELGQYPMIKLDITGASDLQNVSGRIYDAFTNRTFTNDYALTVYQQQKIASDESQEEVTMREPVVALEFYGTVGFDYYTGFFEIPEMKQGAYLAVAESKGYHRNFERFYVLKDASNMKGIPMVPRLEDGQLALVLTWGNAFAEGERDLDINVEFVASDTLICSVDFTNRRCGGVSYLTDTVDLASGSNADVIKFDSVNADFQYLVYVSSYSTKTAQPKIMNTQQPSIVNSQPQLKLYAAGFDYPVMTFEVPPQTNVNFQTHQKLFWNVFCLNGKDSLKGILPLNTLTPGNPDVRNLCHKPQGANQTP